MFFLILAIICSALIGIIMRISSDKVRADRSMLAMNYLVCSVLAAAYCGFQVGPIGAGGFSVAVGLGAIGGVLFLGGFILLQMNTKKNGIVLSQIFMKLGLLVPITMSIFLFKEMPTWLQATGFCIAIGAIVLINVKQGDKSRKSGFGIGLILLLLVGGGADVMSKIFEVYGNPKLNNHFLFYIFVVAFVLCLCLVFVKKERPGKTDLLFGALIGIPNFFSSKFLLGALMELPAVIVYPTYSVGGILVVTLAGIFLFKERLLKLQWIALVAILIALVFLNV